MKKSSKLLSIIIPTYNGGEWIEDTLLSVLSQLNDFDSIVEFIVRDNCSTDNTQEIIKNLNIIYNNKIKYNRRSETVKANQNFREAIMLATGEYIVMLGDDDLLFPGYIANTLNLINKYPGTGLFYYNRIATSRDYLGATLKHNNPNYSFERVYDSAKYFIQEYPSGPDFMSVNVVKRDCIVEGIKYANTQYYGVEWYAGILYGIKGKQCVSTFSPMILQRYPLKRFWDDKMLLYVIVGMDNLFKDMDIIYPGIYNIWNNYSKENIPRLPWIVKCIKLNRQLYVEKFDELRDKLNPIERITAYALVKAPFTYYPIKLVYYLYRMFSILKTSLNR